MTTYVRVKVFGLMGLRLMLEEEARDGNRAPILGGEFLY
jgi:hypothetical protein